MISHRKTLLPVGGSCLSAAGGGGGLRESTHTLAYNTCHTLTVHLHPRARYIFLCFWLLCSPPAAPFLDQHRRGSENLGERNKKMFYQILILTFSDHFVLYIPQLFVPLCVKYVLFGVSVSLMADTVFKADFRGSWTLETTGLKEEDSSVEIYMENTLTEEARHKQTPKAQKRQIQAHACKQTGHQQVRAQTQRHRGHVLM